MILATKAVASPVVVVARKSVKVNCELPSTLVRWAKPARASRLTLIVPAVVSVTPPAVVFPENSEPAVALLTVKKPGLAAMTAAFTRSHR